MKTHLRTYNLLPTLDDCIKSCLSQLTSFALENSDEIESRKILTILYNKMRHNNQLRFNYNNPSARVYMASPTSDKYFYRNDLMYD